MIKKWMLLTAILLGTVCCFGTTGIRYQNIEEIEGIRTILPSPSGRIDGARFEFQAPVAPGSYLIKLKYRTFGNEGGLLTVFVKGTSLQTSSWQDIQASPEWSELILPVKLTKPESLNLAFTQQTDIMGKFDKLQLKDIELVPYDFKPGQNYFPNHGYFSGMVKHLPEFWCSYARPVDPQENDLTDDFGFEHSKQVFRIYNGPSEKKPTAFVSRKFFFPESGTLKLTVWARAESGAPKMRILLWETITNGEHNRFFRCRIPGMLIPSAQNSILQKLKFLRSGPGLT